MRFAFVGIVLTALVACNQVDNGSGNATARIEDGLYMGSISSGGCMSGSLMKIEVVAGKASFPSSSMCLTNESTSGELHYDCTQGGGESHYVCVMQGSVHEIHDRVDAMATSTGMLEGTIERVSTTYSPPNCLYGDRSLLGFRIVRAAAPTVTTSRT